jgi:Flp pilus assembly protein TadD
LLWGEGEQGAARRAQGQPAQAAQLKGVFGEGASVVAVPESTIAENKREQRVAEAPAAEARQALTPEQLQRKAQSRGLWDSGTSTASTAAQAQAGVVARTGALPRAVVGTASPASAANTNYRSPSIGNDAQGLPAAAAAPQGLAESQAPVGEALHAAQPAPERDEDAKDTVQLDMGAYITRPESQPDQPEASQPSAAAPSAVTTPEPKTEQLATRPAPSSTNSAVLLTLIFIAAVIAVLFIGAALGVWRLPWAASATHSSLSKTVPAKSLPEMRTAAAPAAPPAPPATATAIAATAPAAEALPTAAAATEQTAQPGAPTTVSGDDVAVMAAEEAAPLHAAASSGGDPEDEADRPAMDTAQVLTAARAELRKGQAQEAETMLRPLFEQNPDDHHIAEALAQALIARGGAIEAVSIAQVLVKKHPKRAGYRLLLGDALRRAGDEPSAKAAYREALAIDPNLRDAHKRLAPKARPSP